MRKPGSRSSRNSEKEQQRCSEESESSESELHILPTGIDLEMYFRRSTIRPASAETGKTER